MPSSGSNAISLPSPSSSPSRHSFLIAAFRRVLDSWHQRMWHSVRTQKQLCENKLLPDWSSPALFSFFLPSVCWALEKFVFDQVFFFLSCCEGSPTDTIRCEQNVWFFLWPEKSNGVRNDYRSVKFIISHSITPLLYYFHRDFCRKFKNSSTWTFIITRHCSKVL